MQSKQTSEEKWEVIKNKDQEQSKNEEWESLQTEEAIEGGSKSQDQVVEGEAIKEEWQLVGQLQDSDKSTSQQPIETQLVESPIGLQGVVQDISESMCSIRTQLATALSFVKHLPNNVIRMVKGAKGSEVGVVVLGVVAGGLLVSLLALSNRTYFWKAKAQRVYGDMIKLIKKTEDINGVFSISKRPSVFSTATDFA
eukprot:TRINITY_DN5289_c0_g1_i7.p2 TRINITY_DN5289_c0_g1~~TRINITY_DN5289_c0_g1_i7.p2  ORF type:complete len:197 (+),score=23.94 TRINITY_DN5289_c0_g1_i7:363-953(+)